MPSEGEGLFTAGVILNFVIALGITWVIWFDIYSIPESLGWLVRAYFAQTSYVTFTVLMKTSIAAKAMRVVKWCIGTAFVIVLFPFALLWQVANLLFMAGNRSMAQQRVSEALENIPWKYQIATKPSSDVPLDVIGKAAPVTNLKSTYHYQKLLRDRDFRLLELFPPVEGEGQHGPLRGTIIHARPGETPQFTALSYCWNDTTYANTNNNSVDPVLDLGSEGCLVLTRNLFNALQSARGRGHLGSNLFWVDQICINQEDLAEKSRQVSLMKNIYQKAGLVLVWLGDDTPLGDAERALRFADHIAKCIDEHGLLSPEFDFFPITFTSNDLGIPPIHRATMDYLALFRLLTRPWFQRSWVVQEVSLNDNKRVLCGSTETTFNTLATALLFCTKSMEFLAAWIPLEARDAFRAMIQSSVFTMRDHAPPSSSLLDVLVRHRGCQATLPSDKVFAFLNISNDGDALGIKPDYTACPRNVFIETAVAMIKFYDHLDILSSANGWPYGRTNGLVTAKGSEALNVSHTCIDDTGTCLDPNHPAHLPSWAPDWSIPTFAPSFQSKGEFGEYFSNYRASGNSVKKVQFRANNTQLGVDAVMLDHIVSVGPGFMEDTGLDIGHHYRTIKTWGDMCGAWDKKKEYIFSQEDMPTAFANTMTCGGKEITKKSAKPTPTPSAEKDAQPEPDANKKDWLGGEDTFEAQFNQLLVVFWVNWIVNGIWPGIAARHWIYGIFQTFFAVAVYLLEGPRKILGRSVPMASVSSGFRHRLMASVTHRRFICTKFGMIGLASPQAEPGDFIMLISGCNVPVVVRFSQGGPEPDTALFEIVGDAYVHGAMFGEAYGRVPNDQHTTLWII